MYSMPQVSQAGVFCQLHCSPPGCPLPYPDFMEALAIPGSTCLHHSRHTRLSKKQGASSILRIAASIKPDEYAVALDWHHTSESREFLLRGRVSTTGTAITTAAATASHGWTDDCHISGSAYTFPETFL